MTLLDFCVHKGIACIRCPRRHQGVPAVVCSAKCWYRFRRLLDSAMSSALWCYRLLVTYGSISAAALVQAMVGYSTEDSTR